MQWSQYSFIALAAVPVEDSKNAREGRLVLLFISCFQPSLKTTDPKNGHGSVMLLMSKKSKEPLLYFETSKESMSF